MKIKVLGCSGGIGGALRTTSFLVDDDILIDAGSGVGDLSIEQLPDLFHVAFGDGVSHSGLSVGANRNLSVMYNSAHRGRADFWH